MFHDLPLTTLECSHARTENSINSNLSYNNAYASQNADQWEHIQVRYWLHSDTIITSFLNTSPFQTRGSCEQVGWGCCLLGQLLFRPLWGLLNQPLAVPADPGHRKSNGRSGRDLEERLRHRHTCKPTAVIVSMLRALSRIFTCSGYPWKAMHCAERLRKHWWLIVCVCMWV